MLAIHWLYIVADPALPGLLVAIGNLACALASSATPLDGAVLDELYPNHGSYVMQVALAANALRAQGLLLPKDAMKIRTAAAQSIIGCGIGFELALVLSPLLWLHRRRRVH